MNKKYTASVNKCTARPRSQRLQTIGGSCVILKNLGINGEAQATPIDLSMSATSSRAVANKVIKAYADKVAQEAEDAAIRGALEGLSADEIYIKYTDCKMSLLLAQDGGLGTPDGMQGLGIVSIPEGLLSDYAKKEETSKTFATIAALNLVDGRLTAIEDYFSSEEDADTLINKWNEIVAFLNATEGTTLDNILSSKADKSDIPTKVGQLENDKGYITEHQDISGLATKKELGDGLNSKQNVISDLDTIRAGAALGATALQAVPDNYVTEKELTDKGYITSAAIANKVDKEDGKGLSSNDYTDAEKSKLASIADGAEVNVQADWNATSGDAFIKNKPSLHKVATSGSYNDLANKPTIPAAVTESTVTGWGFTKNTGTYIKPSTGIPKSDLASDVQTSLGKADTALQEHQSLAGYATQAWVNLQGFLKTTDLGDLAFLDAITSKMVTDALGFTPFDSAAFTKTSIKNALGIADWALAANKPSYNFSEIGSKPTTLSGYGITDAVKYGSGFAPTAADSPTIIGYSGIGEGWPVGGPAMRWGINGYYARLQIELNANNPRLLLSGVYNNAEYEWVEILTDKNFSSFGIANMSNNASGSANDILTSSVNGVVESLTDIPLQYGNLLTFAPKNAYYQSQLIINYQSDMAIRCRSGSWSDWAKVVTDKNFATYGVKAGSLNMTGSANDIIVPSIVGDVESLQNVPFHYCNILTITTTPHYYVGQIAIDYAGRMAVRGQDGVTWSSWRTILDTNNIGTTSLPSLNLNGETITSWNDLKASGDYLPLTGGTLTGNLTVNGKVSASGLSISTATASLTFTDNIIYSNASLRIYGGWSLRLGANGTGIQEWTDLKTVLGLGSLAYKNSIEASDISSIAWDKITGKPTTLAGYGITDAMKVCSEQSNLDFNDLVTTGAYTIIGGTNTHHPLNYGTLLTIHGNSSYFIGQVAILYNGQMYVRAKGDIAGTDGDYWEEWRTVVDSVNVSQYAISQSVADSRYLKLTGGTLTGQLYVENSAGDRYIHSKCDTAHIAFGVGSGGENRGIFDINDAKWWIVRDNSDYTEIVSSTISLRGKVRAVGVLEAGSGITLGNVTRTSWPTEGIAKNSILLPNNAFDNFGKIQFSQLDNALYGASYRFNITLNGFDSDRKGVLFNGNYEDSIKVPMGQTATIRIDNNGSYIIAGYPYGKIVLSFYYLSVPASVSIRVYNTYGTPGWYTLPLSEVRGSRGGVFIFDNTSYYGVTEIEITITAKADIEATLCQIDWFLTRASLSNLPVVTKFGIDQELWGRLICQGGITLGNETITSWDDVGAMETKSQTTTSGTVSIAPNVLNKWSSVLTGTLTITFASGASGVANYYMLEFTTGSSIPTINLPSGVKWEGGYNILNNLAANTTYQISILNNLAVGGAFV